MSAAEVTALAAVATGIATVVTAWVAIGTLKQHRADSRARTRPMVVAELRDVPYVDSCQALVIRNVGPSVANNLRVSFDPEIPDPENPAESGAPFLKKRYSTPIAHLAPGVELDNTWFMADRPGGENIEPMPDQASVRLRYEGPDGTPYDEDYRIDVQVIRNRTYVTSSKDPTSMAKETLKVRKQIAGALQVIAKSAGSQQG